VRLFVAVYPSEEVVSDLERALAPVRDLEAGLRWSPAEQWHVTLAFLGEVAEGKLDELAERLGRAAARSGPTALHLGRLGAFPTATRARACWAAVEGEPAATESLRHTAGRARAAAKRAGIDVDDKPYRPHVTVARARRAPVDARPLVEALGGHAGPAWVAAEFRLVRSHLGSVLRHETLLTWPFGDAHR
jgi:2'-5' RNA ligase